MSAPTCKAAREKTLRGAFGERCGKPATATDWLGRDVCAACLAYSEEAKRDVKSLGNVLGEIYQRRAGKGPSDPGGKP